MRTRPSKDECAFYREKGHWKKDCPRLKNHDGSTRVLKDVRYMPNLKKNLISLGALESKCLAVTMQDRILKATSSTLMVMKFIKKNNKYYYQGSSIIGTTAIATTSGDDKMSKVSRLWHMRLGHASEKSLQILVKQGLLKFCKDLQVRLAS